MSVLSEVRVWGNESYDSPDEGYVHGFTEQSGVCIRSFPSPPIPLRPTQVAVPRRLGDRYKWKRPHAASLTGSVHPNGLQTVCEQNTLGKREFLGKSVITTQQQTLSMTHIQLFNNVDKKFSVKLETPKGVHCGDIEIESGKW